MIGWLRALLAIGLLGVCGACLLSMLPRSRKRDRLLDLALSLPLGLVAVTLTYALFDWLRLPFRPILMTACWLVLAAAAAMVRRRTRTRHTVATDEASGASSVDEPRAIVLTGLLAAVLLLIDVAAFGLTLSRPVTGTDPMGIWTARAILIYERGDLDSRELERRATFYPPLVPSGLAWLMASLGERDYVRIKLLNPCLLLALQLLLLRGLKGQASTWSILAGALLLCSSLVSLACVWEPLADLALAVYLVLAAVMLLRVMHGDARAFALVVVAAIGGFLSRPEGLPAAAGILALAAWSWPRRAAGLRYAALGALLTAAVLWCATCRFKGYEPFGAPQGFAEDVSASFTRIRSNTAYILGYFFERLQLLELWGYVWLLPLAVLVMRARTLARNREAHVLLLLALWIAFVHYLSYVLYPGEVRQHLPLSGDRVPYRFTFPIVLAAIMALRSPAPPELRRP